MDVMPCMDKAAGLKCALKRMGLKKQLKTCAGRFVLRNYKNLFYRKILKVYNKLVFW